MKKHNTYIFILMKSDSSSFKIGFTTNLDETMDYFEDIFRFRRDRSFVFEGEYSEMRNLHKLLTSMLYNFRISEIAFNEDYADIFNIKGLDLLNDFTENLSKYKIKTQRTSLRKVLEECKPHLKIISRKNRVNLLFDYNTLNKEQLEYKYNMDFEKIQKIYEDFRKEMYKPHRDMFKSYLKMKKELDSVESTLIKSI